MGWKMRDCGHMRESYEAVECWLFMYGESTTFFLTETEILINLFFIHYLKKKKDNRLIT